MAMLENRKGNKTASLIASAAIAAAMTFVGVESSRAADDWPSRPITMINPFAAGGPNDVPARMFAQRMGEALGQQVIVENVGGAGGMIGAQRVAKAAPDGYTFLVGTVGTQAQNQLLYKKPAYDATKDFTSVGLFLEAPLVLVARKDFPASNLKDFVAYAKQNGSKMQFASAGTGSAIHLGCALLNSVTGIDVVHVPYRGANPAMQDLASGRVDYLCDIVTTAKPQIDGGAISRLRFSRMPVHRRFRTCRPRSNRASTSRPIRGMRIFYPRARRRRSSPSSTRRCSKRCTILRSSRSSRAPA